MIRVEVIEDFTLQRYDELKNIQRRNLDTKGKLYKGDTFECSEELTKYLSGDNKLKKAFVRVIEVLPKEESKVEMREEPEIIETIDTSIGKVGYGTVEVKETKPKKKKASKK